MFFYTRIATGKFIVVGFLLGSRVLFREAFEMLEPCALRGARTVLRGLGASNGSRLPDHVRL